MHPNLAVVCSLGPGHSCQDLKGRALWCICFQAACQLTTVLNADVLLPVAILVRCYCCESAVSPRMFHLKALCVLVAVSRYAQGGAGEACTGDAAYSNNRVLPE